MRARGERRGRPALSLVRRATAHGLTPKGLSHSGLTRVPRSRGILGPRVDLRSPEGDAAKRTLLLCASLLLAACQTVPENYIQYHAGQDALTIAERIANHVGTCWFDGKHKAFAEYSYAPELSSPSRPRVLIVDKADPQGLPQLVIEVIKAKRGSDVRLFGPLMATDDADDIQDDLRRWTGGAREC